MKTPPLIDLRALSPLAWVALERQRQDEKWGEQNHNISRWQGILLEEVGELAKFIEDANYIARPDNKEFHQNVEYELIQIAAVAVAVVEAIRREKGSERLPICACSACEIKRSA